MGMNWTNPKVGIYSPNRISVILGTQTLRNWLVFYWMKLKIGCITDVHSQTRFRWFSFLFIQTTSTILY